MTNTNGNRHDDLTLAIANIRITIDAMTRTYSNLLMAGIDDNDYHIRSILSTLSDMHKELLAKRDAPQPETEEVSAD